MIRLGHIVGGNPLLLPMAEEPHTRDVRRLSRRICGITLGSMSTCQVSEGGFLTNGRKSQSLALGQERCI